MAARLRFNRDDSDFQDDLDIRELAGFVGFEFPILVRV
jgi:hypothetical protein